MSKKIYCERCSGNIVDGRCNRCFERPAPTTEPPTARGYKPPLGGSSVVIEPVYTPLDKFRDKIAFEYMKHDLNSPSLGDPYKRTLQECQRDAARRSYQMADIMMEERGRKKLDITTCDGNPPMRP